MTKVIKKSSTHLLIFHNQEQFFYIWKLKMCTLFFKGVGKCIWHQLSCTIKKSGVSAWLLPLLSCINPSLQDLPILPSSHFPLLKSESKTSPILFCYLGYYHSLNWSLGPILTSLPFFMQQWEVMSSKSEHFHPLRLYLLPTALGYILALQNPLAWSQGCNSPSHTDCHLTGLFHISTSSCSFQFRVFWHKRSLFSRCFHSNGGDGVGSWKETREKKSKNLGAITVFKLEKKK